MTVWIVISAETHFTAVVSGVQTNIRIERAYASPEAADAYQMEMKRYNPATSYTVERIEVR